MSDRDEEVAFISAAFAKRDTLYVTAVCPTFEDEGAWHGYVFRKSPGDTDRTGWEVQTRIAGVVIVEAQRGVKRTVFVVGQDGRVEVDRPGDNAWEDIDTSAEGPNRLRRLTCVRRIADHLYVAGTRRQVYRRHIGRGPWTRMDAGMLLPAKKVEPVGLQGIDGVTADNLHAVGLGGEIWHYNGKKWRRAASPTNANLGCVRYLDAETVLVAGDSGVILKGFGDRWEIVEQGLTEDNFTGMEPAFDAIYFSTESNLYRLQEGDFEEVDMGLGEIDVYGLTYADSYLVSVGTQDVAGFNGKKWKLIMHEDLSE